MLDKYTLPAWGSRKLADIGPGDCIRLDRNLRESVSEATAANYLKAARAVFAYAVGEEYIEISPFAKVPRGKLSSCNTKREHREWTTADVERLIRVGYERDEREVKSRETDVRGRAPQQEYGLAIELKLRLGLRLGELLGCQYGDFVTEERDGVKSHVLFVRRQWTKDGRVDSPKTEYSVRRIPLLPAEYAKVAARKLRLGASDDDFVFASKRGGNPPLHSNFRKRGWNPAVKDAGLTDGPKVTPHDARHAAASHMADLGLSSADVRDTLGHSSSTVTESIYIHAFDRDKREQRIREARAAAAGGGAS